MSRVRLRPLEDPRSELDHLKQKGLNFDPSTLESTDANWIVDEYRQALPAEGAGDPEQAGSWTIARKICADYGFVDDAIVRAIYDPGQALDERNILLEVHFWRFIVYAPVRVGGSFDGMRTEDGKPVRVWGWHYRTLEGHFEMGQIDYEVWKWTHSGEVEFRIQTVSRAAPIRDPILRFGFLVFGRRKQIQFAKRACQRMARLTSASLKGGSADGSPTHPEPTVDLDP